MDDSRKAEIFRKCFFGRQDVYGEQWAYGKGYSPACVNKMKPFCHIKLKDGVSCMSCEFKQYIPVSDESVLKHIKGQEAHLHYMVQSDSTTYFFAWDCDMKPNKEHLGHGWESVKNISNVLKSMKIPHSIARSTGSEHLYGYHIYVFIDKPYPTNKVRAIANYVFLLTGMEQEDAQGMKPKPEFFPKQDYTCGLSVGNGIKPPMIEKNWERGRNGFVTGEDEFISPEKQWEYLENAPRVTTELLDEIIEENELPVRDIVTSGTHRSSPNPYIPGLSPDRPGKWQQPLRGSYEKIVEGCKALRRVYARSKEGHVASHHEGFAAFHLAMHTQDGVDYFNKNMTGWSRNDRDIRQLEHSLDKNYAPWTCLKMQEMGVCPSGTKCFEKRPPVTIVEGKYVVNNEAPREHWPEPSPIRYSFGAGEDFLEKLKTEISAIEKDMDENEKGAKIRDIAKRSQVFDQDQRRELKEFIKSKKILKWGDISKMFTQAGDEHFKEVKKQAATREDIASVGNVTYHLNPDPIGYEIVRKGKEGNTEFVRFSDVVVEVNQEIEEVDDGEPVRSFFRGKIRAEDFESSFEIDMDAWNDTKEFVKFFGKKAGTRFLIHRQDIDNLRQAAQAFSCKYSEKRVHYATQGYHKDTYLMPDVLIDADGIRPNTEMTVSLDSKPHAQNIGFKILQEDELGELIFHINNTMLNAWPRAWTMIGLSHALLPAVLKIVGIRKKPALFFEGTTGAGKTELLHTLQYFWGQFDSIINLASTGKGMMTVAHDFKDCLLAFDDYKGMSRHQTDALQHMIQYSYDPNISVKLRRDSSLMPPKNSRGVIAFTGEHFLTNDSAMVARCLIVEMDKQDTSKTRDAYNEVIEMRDRYCGVTPHFIKWFLNQDAKKWKEEFNNLYRDIYSQDGVCGRVNADRVSYNIALNMIVWRMWVTFVRDVQMLNEERCQALIDEHAMYARTIMFEMLSRCGDEQNGEVFLRHLNQLISSGRAIIEGYNDDDPLRGGRAVTIGFLHTPKNGGEVIANIFPDLACQLIKEVTKDNPIRGTEREFGRLFLEKGIILPSAEKGRYRRQVRYNRTKAYVWPMIAKRINIDLDEKDDVGELIQGGRSMKRAVNFNDIP